MTGGGEDCDVEQPSSNADGSGLVDCAECRSSGRRNCEGESGDDMLMWSKDVDVAMISMAGGLQMGRLHMHGKAEGTSVVCEPEADG